ncbi:MAG: S41 family peptidase [Spirochaetaceae bacterium]|jgi:carboxyl-terminal processing protease|nr:S41 family peptidase [Spirochaetaceae bacterium]
MKPIKNLSGRKSFSAVLWLVPTLVLCGIFIIASVPRLEAQGKDQSSRHYTNLLQNVFDFIQNHYVEDVDPKVVYEGALRGMFGALGDPYSAYLQESEMADLSENVIQGTYGGVGLYISKPVNERPDGRPLYVEVASPIEDTPGWRAGLKPGDLIKEINGEATDALTMDEVLTRLKGPPGVEIKLVIRRGKTLEFPVSLVREVIEVPTVKHAMIGDIAYLKLISFNALTVERTRTALGNFQTQGYKGLVLDLRNNYGGLLQSAVGIGDFFLEGGVVVSVKSRIASENTIFNARRTTLVPSEIPVVVLINRGSASASEIVAGALKDRGRAYLVGEKSFGKGSVQQVYPLDKAGFKITTARYYTPSDVNIDKIGIPPDLEVLFPEFTEVDSEQLSALIGANKIPLFVEENPGASAGQVDRFVRELNEEYQLDVVLLRRLVRDEQNRTVIVPIYDMEYDVQLQEAVKILRGGAYNALMRTTKTLRVLQEESSEEEGALAS